jgi:uncharacterized membrane protein
MVYVRGRIIAHYISMKTHTHKSYRNALLISVLLMIIMMVVFSILMMNAEYGTETRKAYQTWLTYSFYVGISLATVIGVIWYFATSKKSVGYRKTEEEMKRQSHKGVR